MRLSRLAVILLPLVVCRACTCYPQNDNTGCEYDGGPTGPYGGGYGYGGGGAYATPCNDLGGTCATSFNGPPSCPPGTSPASPYEPTDCSQFVGGVCCLPNSGLPEASSPCSETGGTCVFGTYGPPVCPPNTRLDRDSYCYPASGACCVPVDGGAGSTADAAEDGAVEEGGEDATEDVALDGTGEDAGAD